MNAALGVVMVSANAAGSRCRQDRTKHQVSTRAAAGRGELKEDARDPSPWQVLPLLLIASSQNKPHYHDKAGE